VSTFPRQAQDGKLGLHIEGDEELVEHREEWLSLGALSSAGRVDARLAKKLKRTGEVVLSKKLREMWGVDEYGAHALFNEIGFEMAVSQCLKTGIVTNQPIHIEILTDFKKSAELDRRNALIQRHLTCMVPFLNGVKTKDLLTLRKTEADAFLSFRGAFTRAVDEHIKAKNGQFNARDAEAIFGDIIEPELARLNRKISTAKRSMLRKSGAGVFGWVAALSVGHYFGFVESSLVNAAKALGLTKVAADLVACMTGSTGENAIRDENLYFLWKVRHRAQSEDRFRDA
jgi:hypothetical protein